jgi:hypothetical protein
MSMCLMWAPQTMWSIKQVSQLRPWASGEEILQAVYWASLSALRAKYRQKNETWFLTQGTAGLVVKRFTEYYDKVCTIKGSTITCFVSKLTKQYPRGCPSKAPDLWKRKSNCFTLPNFWRSLRRWYLWKKKSNESTLGILLVTQP